jgi:predicted amidophosphoribosyltransferase
MLLKDLRRKLDLCIACGIELDRNGIYCITCNNIYNGLKHDYTLQLYQNGLCTNCTQPMDRKGWMCKTCCKKLNNRGKIRAQFRRDNKLCVQCGIPITEYTYCRKCLDARMDRYWKNKIKDE